MPRVAGRGSSASACRRWRGGGALATAGSMRVPAPARIEAAKGLQATAAWRGVRRRGCSPGPSATGTAVSHKDTWPARKRRAWSRLSGAGLALMRRRAARSVADSSREGVVLVHSSRPRMSQAAGVGVMTGTKAGTAKRAAGERRPPGHVSPKRLVSPEPFARSSSRRREVHPGGPATLAARVSPRGSSSYSSAGGPVYRPESGEPR